MITKGKRYSLLGYPGPKGEDGAGAAISAGSVLITGGTVNFQNSNGVTFGLGANSVMTASVSMGTAVAGDHSHSQYLTTAQAPGAYLTTAMQSQNTSLYVSTSQSSLFQHTSATSAVTANALNTSQSSLLQHTSATSNITSNAFATANSSLLLPIANSTQWATSVLSTKFLTTAQPVGAYLTTAMASNAGSDFIAIGNSTAYQTSVLSSKFLTTAMASNQALYSATSQFSASFINTGQTAGFLTTAAASNHSHGNPTLNLTNLSGTTASASNGFTLSLSAAAPGGGGGIAASIGGNSTSAGAGYSNITSGTMLIAGGSNITLSQAGSVISIVGATANGPASVIFQDGNGVTWASTVGGSTTTIGASVNAGGAAPAIFEEYMPFAYIAAITNNSSIYGQSSVYFIPFDLENNITVDRINFFNSMGVTSSTASTITGTLTYMAGIYTRAAGANSSVMSSIWSDEAYAGWNLCPTSYSIIHPNGFADSVNVSYSTYNQANAASTQTVYGRDSLQGLRAWQMPVSSSFSPGRYWLGFGIKSTQGTGTASFNVRVSHHYQSLAQAAYVKWGTVSQASNYASANAAWQGAGSYRAQTAAMPGSVILNGSDIKFMTNLVIPMFNFSALATNASNI